MSTNLQEQGFLRLKEIIGDRKRGVPAIIPVSPSTWWAGVKTGRFPKPVKLSERCTAWRYTDIKDLSLQLASQRIIRSLL